MSLFNEYLEKYAAYLEVRGRTGHVDDLLNELDILWWKLDWQDQQKVDSWIVAANRENLADVEIAKVLRSHVTKEKIVD